MARLRDLPFGRLLCRAFATSCAWLRIARGLYRFDTEIEVIAFGADVSGQRIMDFSIPLSNAEMRELGGIVPDDAPPQERPWGGPYSRSKPAFLSRWTNDDEDYGIAGDGMSDDADAFGLLLLKAAESHPSFAIEIPRGMYRFESDIVLWMPAAEATADMVLDRPRFSSGDRIPVREPAVSDEVFWITLP